MNRGVSEKRGIESFSIFKLKGRIMLLTASTVCKRFPIVSQYIYNFEVATPIQGLNPLIQIIFLGRSLYFKTTNSNNNEITVMFRSLKFPLYMPREIINHHGPLSLRASVAALSPTPTCNSHLSATFDSDTNMDI